MEVNSEQEKNSSKLSSRNNDKPSTQIQVDTGTDKFQPGNCNDGKNAEYQQIFRSYYARLAQILPVDELLPDLVSNELVTMEEMEVILAEKRSSMKARSLLMGMWRSVSGGYQDSFVKILCLMQMLPNEACTSLSREICVKLGIHSETITNAVLSEL